MEGTAHLLLRCRAWGAWGSALASLLVRAKNESAMGGGAQASRSPRNHSTGEQALSAGVRGMRPDPTSPRASEVVIDVPDVAAQRVGCPLQRPGEQGQLAPEAALLEAQAPRHLGLLPKGLRATRAQQPHVVH